MERQMANNDTIDIYVTAPLTEEESTALIGAVNKIKEKIGPTVAGTVTTMPKASYEAIPLTDVEKLVLSKCKLNFLKIGE